MTLLSNSLLIKHTLNPLFRVHGVRFSERAEVRRGALTRGNTTGRQHTQIIIFCLAVRTEGVTNTGLLADCFFYSNKRD